jgi:predicted nucleic acid-binding Zn ribbon protein
MQQINFNKTVSIKDVINQSFKNMKMSQKVDEMRIVTRWEEIAGKLIAKYTENVYISNKTLYLKVNSAPLKNELFNLKAGILDKVNEGFENIIVKDIVLL